MIFNEIYDWYIFAVLLLEICWKLFSCINAVIGEEYQDSGM